ncbi:MAG: L-histidine N(alpha)-methyltransferase [Actinomycetota bacterium]|nr:L-histidine N(alpha)-methyltransferase [Actinomycetota bacterium]
MTGVAIDNRLAAAPPTDLAAEVREGLTRPLRELPPKLFYDSTGSDLFDRITELPEYYPTRCEREILEARAGDIVRDVEELVELGSGSYAKARVLLDTGAIRRYVPVDVSESVVERSAVELRRRYPGLEVHGLIGDFHRDLVHLPEGENRLFAFLGGTIGNLHRDERARFLSMLRELMGPEDRLLLGTDLVKDTAVLEAAYNDSQGVTAEFNRNALRVLNRELDGDFDPERFDHVAFFDEDEAWIEMRLRSREAQTARIERAGLEVELAPGEDIRTEISAKFTPETIEAALAESGLELTELWTDSGGRFALSLSAPPARPGS